MDLGSFTITAIPDIRFGRGRLDEVPDLLADYGRRALVVIGSRSFQESHHWERLAGAMRDRGIEWEVVNVHGEPSPESVDAVVSRYKDSGIDVVLAIGGGSVLDAAKAIAGLLKPGNSVMDHLEAVGRGVPYTGPRTPSVAVPTTAGTGSEATKNAVLSSTGPEGFKRSFRSDLLVPDVAVIDPSLADTCPSDVTAASGMDAFTQLLESHVSTAANPFTDALAWSGIQAVKEGFPAAREGEEQGRDLMAYAALVSGITLAQVSLGIVHGLASPLGGFFPIPHNVACAILLPAATKVNIRALLERLPESPALTKYAEVGRLLSDSLHLIREMACDALVETLYEWRDQMNLPPLSHYGVTESDIPKIVAAAFQLKNPVQLSQEEIASIVRECRVQSSGFRVMSDE